MSFKGRSPDDLPLAAYTTGVTDDEPDEDIAEPSQLSQQDAIALAMGIEPASAAEPVAAASAGGVAIPRPSMPSLTLPRLALPRLSLPRLSLPRFAVPRFSRGLSPRREAPVPAVAAESPFEISPATLAMSVAHAAPLAPAAVARPGRTRRLDAGDVGATLRNPRIAARDPRVLFGGMIGIGVVLLGLSVLGGGSPRGVVTGASPSAPPGAGVPTTPGPGTIQVAGDFEATFTLTGTVAIGKPADGLLAATWGDGAGSSFTLTGPVASNMRTTSPGLTLAVTVMRNGAPVTFTSEAGECTIGMAEKISNVTGSFVCPEIRSNGGRFTVKLSGSYQT
jgi:hypothetical protein